MIMYFFYIYINIVMCVHILWTNVFGICKLGSDTKHMLYYLTANPVPWHA